MLAAEYFTAESFIRRRKSDWTFYLHRKKCKTDLKWDAAGGNLQKILTKGRETKICKVSSEAIPRKAIKLSSGSMSRLVK